MNKENTEQVVYDFLVNDLKVPRTDVDKYVFQDMHSLGGWGLRNGFVYRNQLMGEKTCLILCAVNLKIEYIMLFSAT